MNKLEEMKKDCGELDGIYCLFTKENVDKVKLLGFKCWSEHTICECDTILCLDRDEQNKVLYRLYSDEKINYREFIFVDDIPQFTR